MAAREAGSSLPLESIIGADGLLGRIAEARTPGEGRDWRAYRLMREMTNEAITRTATAAKSTC